MLKIHPRKKNNDIKESSEIPEEQGEFPIELLQFMQTRDNLELEDRGIIFINSVITKQTLDRAYRRLLSLHFNPNFHDPIQILINSEGGYTDAGWAFIDMMEFVENEIITIAIGEIASMATSIFIAGDERIMSPNSVAMIHEFSTGTAGSYAQLVAGRKAEDIEYQKDLQHLIRHSRYTTEAQITTNLLKETDNWLTPKEMLFHGLCDKITAKRRRKKAKKKSTKRKN